MKTVRRPIRNPFYAAVQRGGICFANPIKSLPHGNRVASNPYYDRIVTDGGVCVAMGRPSRHEKARPTVVKSVRLPPEVWKRVQDQAARERIPVNAAVRQAILIWLQS